MVRINMNLIRHRLEEIGYPQLAFLGTLTVGHIIIHWYTNLLSLALPFIKENLNLNDVEVGTIITVQMGISSGCFIICGFLADSYQHRGSHIVLAGIISLGLAFFIIGIAPSYIWILVGATMVGFGTALWHPAAMRALSVEFPSRRGMALSVHGVGASVGDTIGPLIVGAIILSVDWKLTLELHLLPSLIIALLLWRGLRIMRVPGDITHSRGTYTSGMKTLFQNPQVVTVIASNTLIQMSRLSMLAFFPIYIKDTLGYSPFILGVYLALLYVMGIFSQPILGGVSDLIGRKAILIPSFVCMSLLYLATAIVPSGIILGLVIGLLGIFFYAMQNLTQTAVMDVAPERVQASTMGIMGLFGLPFILGSPIFAGYLVTLFGIKSAFWYASVTAFFAAIILINVRFSKPHPL